MKYVRHRELGLFVFGDQADHEVVAVKLGIADIVSAGFVLVSDKIEETVCFGDSYSLRLKSEPIDTVLLRLMIFGRGK